MAASLAPLRAGADYSPPVLNDLILGSDAIVIGEIDEVGSDTYRLRVVEVVAGSISAPTIEVERFVDWTCAARWAPYARGQRVLLFATAEPNGRFRIRSAGGEGEMPVVGAQVYVSGFYAQLAPSGADAYGRHGVYGGTSVGFALDVAAFASALRDARACFAADVTGRYRQLTNLRVTCSADHLRAAARSPLGAAIVRALTP